MSFIIPMFRFVVIRRKQPRHPYLFAGDVRKLEEMLPNDTAVRSMVWCIENGVTCCDISGKEALDLYAGLRVCSALLQGADRHLELICDDLFPFFAELLDATALPGSAEEAYVARYRDAA